MVKSSMPNFIKAHFLVIQIIYELLKIYNNFKKIIERKYLLIY